MMTVATTGTKREWPLLALRLVVGYGFLAHGLAKAIKGPEGFAKLLHIIGVPFPAVTAWGVMLLEILGGVALLIGLLVTLASVPLIASMIVAMFTIHLRNGFSAINTIGLTPSGPIFGPPGFEINLLYIAALLVLATLGPGPLAVRRGALRQR
jgi:putative oxidoreductase